MALAETLSVLGTHLKKYLLSTGESAAERSAVPTSDVTAAEVTGARYRSIAASTRAATPARTAAAGDTAG